MLVYRKEKYIYDALNTIAQNKTFIVKKISLWLREISLFIKATMTPSWSSHRNIQLDLQIKLVWKGINIYSQLYVLPSRDLFYFGSNASVLKNIHSTEKSSFWVGLRLVFFLRMLKTTDLWFQYIIWTDAIHKT